MLKILERNKVKEKPSLNQPLKRSGRKPTGNELKPLEKCDLPEQIEESSIEEIINIEADPNNLDIVESSQTAEFYFTKLKRSLGIYAKNAYGEEDVLSERESLFIEALMSDPEMNAYKAYKKAGWKSTGPDGISTARVILERPIVKAEIERRVFNRKRRLEIREDKVLREVARIAFFDIRKLYDEHGNLKKIVDLDEDTALALSSIEAIVRKDGEAYIDVMKVKAYDKLKGLTMLGDHLGGLFSKKSELSIKAEIRKMTGVMVVPQRGIDLKEWSKIAKQQQDVISMNEKEFLGKE